MRERLLPKRSSLWLALIAIALMLIGALGLVVRYADIVSNIAARIAAFSPYLMLATVLGLFIAIAIRFWALVPVGVALVAAAAISQLPLAFSSAPDGPGDLTVVQANIFKGDADISSLARSVADKKADILTVSELTEGARTEIAASSIARQLPYSVVRTSETGGSGIGLYSRFPLSDGEILLHDFRMSNARAVATIPGHGRYAVYAVHPVPPYPEPAWHWNAELEELGQRFAAETLPVIVAGDFNSTYDHPQLRKLFDNSSGRPGMLDAAEYTGAGMVATYPAGHWYPAMLALDRVMTRGGPQPVSFARFEIPGSDHYGVVAHIKL